MKLGLLGFVGSTNKIVTRTSNLGIYRPESNRHIQDFNGNTRTYKYFGEFPLSFNSSVENSLRGLSFSSDGTYVYVMGDATNTVYQYTLNIPWDITSYSSVNPTQVKEVSDYLRSVTSQTYSLTSPQGITFNPTGTRMHILDNTGNGKIVQFTLSTPWMVNTATFPSTAFDSNRPIMVPTTNLGSFASSSSYDICFSSNGSFLYHLGIKPNSVMHVFTYSLKSGRTAFDIGTKTTSGLNYAFTSESNVSSLDANMRGITFNDSGSKLYLCGLTNSWTHQISLTTPYALNPTYSINNFSIRDALYDGSVVGHEGSPEGIFINTSNNNSDLYIVGSTKNKIYQYKLVLK